MDQQQPVSKRFVPSQGQQSLPRQEGSRRDLRAIPIDSVLLPEGRAVLDDDVVGALASSMAEIGLQVPITVLQITAKYQLVAGAHRLAAAKRLGWSAIDAFVARDEVSAKVWEAEENLLHRKLDVLEHSEWLTQWATLVLGDSGQPDHKLGIGRPRGGKAEAARRLPFLAKSEAAARKEIERAEKIAALSPEAKQEIRRLGLADNQSALLDIARQLTADAQIAKARELSTRRESRKTRVRKTEPEGSQHSKEEPREQVLEQRPDLVPLIRAWEAAVDLRRAVGDAPTHVRQVFWEQVVRGYVHKPEHAES